jgi:hypothetical protein
MSLAKVTRVSFRGYQCFVSVQQCWSGYDFVEFQV